MFDPQAPDYDNTPASPTRPSFSYAPADPEAAPQVTIVTPFYNEGPIFHETARSIFRQSFQQWEWIVVNDASPDPVAQQVLAEYRHKDSRIRVIDQPVNQGPSAARNAAFRAARADYAVHLDSDNLLESTAIEKWLWFLESHPECSFVKGFSLGFGAEQYWLPVGFHEGAAFLASNRVDTTSMIRREVHRAVGGFDESIRAGLEDWEFWIRCASRGYWGGTVPECLDWYRRRASHVERWKTWDGGQKEHDFGKQLRRRFPHLWDDGFPKIETRPHRPNETVPDTLPCDNILAKRARRMLLIVPWLNLGGSDKFTLDLLEQLVRRGWEVTIATTLDGPDPWLGRFGRHTPDIFVLHRFLRLPDYPRFLRYLVRSRRPDVVLVTQSELGYHLLPYLRAHCPEATFVDYSHIEEQWKNGGYPRMGVEFQELLDLNVVTSEHLKDWMVRRGADAGRVRVCYINVDTEVWRPDADARSVIRRQLGIDDAVPVVLYVGRICAQKQPKVFGAVMKLLAQRGVSFAALVAGDGPDLPALKASLARHGLAPRVHLLGAVSSERVNELMKAADLLFLPSEWEGIALVIYEAMASGLAIVGADVGGQRELVTPECGVLIARSDEKTEAEEYATVLADLLRDPSRIRRMGQAGRARVSGSFQLDAMGAKMAGLLDEAESLHRTQPRPTPGLGLGRACAAQAIEYVRTTRELDRSWGVAKGDPAAGGTEAGWRERIYAACRVLYAPLYRRAMTRGGAWYFPLAERIKRALLGTRS